MKNTSARPPDAIETAINKYGNMLYKICFIMLQNENDTEDAIQETFIKYYQKAPPFKDSEHEKAWLIKVATNQCRDMLRFRTRHISL